MGKILIKHSPKHLCVCLTVVDERRQGQRTKKRRKCGSGTKKGQVFVRTYLYEPHQQNVDLPPKMEGGENQAATATELKKLEAEVGGKEAIRNCEKKKSCMGVITTILKTTQGNNSGPLWQTGRKKKKKRGARNKSPQSLLIQVFKAIVSMEMFKIQQQKDGTLNL